ncbi:cytosolic iron-sulfur protein assembly protein CIAO1 [Pancytospora philotis]|nr:cytosolic iron-sulfur protein assembly protein CIAO1 [Pancytospora philotis]
MARMEIEAREIGEPVLAVYASDDLYIAAGSKFMNHSTGALLKTHEKSVRCISGNDAYVGCSSYDGTATVFTEKQSAPGASYNTFVETIEGPDTEIKGLAFCDSYIAISTRGKTVWLLEDFEISKILEDHTQDVKGCRFHEGRLYSWSYDNTVNMYEVFVMDHSWELMQTIVFASIVWGVVIIAGRMYVATHDGQITQLEMRDGQWRRIKHVLASAYPVMCCCEADGYLAAVCNKSVLCLFDADLNLVAQELLPLGASGKAGDVFSMCYWAKNNAVVCGSDSGVLYIARIEPNVSENAES